MAMQDIRAEQSASAEYAAARPALGEGDSSHRVWSIWPKAPQAVEETGLSQVFLEDLIIKIIHYASTPTLEQIARRVALPHQLTTRLLDRLKHEHYCEIIGASGFGEMSYQYRLTARGEERADDALARSRYAGAAPVALDQYIAVVPKQSLRSTPNAREKIEAALSTLVLPQDVREGLARALHSGRTTLIFGPSGNGKTTLLEAYGASFDDSVLVPAAIYVHGQILRVFDPALHQVLPEPLEAPAEDANGLLRRRGPEVDRRWLRCRRPVVIVGGELTAEALELAWDPVSRFYQAPPHLRGQDGILLIDDFGRQKLRPEEMLNRWILPMERGYDTFTLHTGESFTIPFDITLLFSTNLSPADLVDEAFLRRIPYKVHIPNPRPSEFRLILERVCEEYGVTYSDESADYLIHKLYDQMNRTPRGCYPRDIVQIIVDSAKYENTEPRLDRELIDRALKVYFLTT